MENEKIIKSLQLTLNQQHVSTVFLKSYTEFLASKDLFTFGSETFNVSFIDFLSQGENRDDVYEFTTAFFNNLLLYGINRQDIYKFVEECLSIKEDLPISEAQVHELGPLNFKNGTVKNYDIFMSMVYLTKLYTVTIDDYLITQLNKKG